MQFKYCISVFILLLFLCKLYNSPDENSTNDYPTTLLCYLIPSKFTAYQNIYFTLLFPLQVTPRLEKKQYEWLSRNPFMLSSSIQVHCLSKYLFTLLFPLQVTLRLEKKKQYEWPFCNPFYMLFLCMLFYCVSWFVYRRRIRSGSQQMLMCWSVKCMSICKVLLTR